MIERIETLAAWLIRRGGLAERAGWMVLRAVCGVCGHDWADICSRPEDRYTQACRRCGDLREQTDLERFVREIAEMDTGDFLVTENMGAYLIARAKEVYYGGN
jgi:hypothetical protein